jgi:hypothetical protein
MLFSNGRNNWKFSLATLFGNARCTDSKYSVHVRTENQVLDNRFIVEQQQQQQLWIGKISTHLIQLG